MRHSVVCSAVLGCVLASVSWTAECVRLNDYILDYQPLVYDRRSVHSNHQRVRRSEDSHFYLTFKAWARQWRVKLWPSGLGVFSPLHQTYIEGRDPHTPDLSFIYHGSVHGEARSWVHLSVHNGSLEGEIQTGETTYYIEPAAKYLHYPAFHTIIYSKDQLNPDPFRAIRGKGGGCGVHLAHVKHFMEEASKLSPQQPDNPPQTSEEQHTAHSHHANQHSSTPTAGHTGPSRHRRAPALKNTCSLHLKADPMLFRYFKYTKHGSEKSDTQVTEEILAFFSDIVSAVSAIFSSTLFQTYTGKVPNTGHSFIIHRTTIMKSCAGVSQDYCSNVVDVANFLDLVSAENHSAYCLMYTFTYRDFAGGVLGLAWIASKYSRQSGVCGQYTRYFEGGMKTLNTGIVTLINYGRTVPTPIAQITFAHEMGHSFGSPHDEGSEECAPFGSNRSDAHEGNYIMFPQATGGNCKNNFKFSTCSRDNITRIIQQVINRQRTMCFIEAGKAFCGNQITEEGEMCDCGFGTCDPRTCCQGRQEHNSSSGCVLLPRAVCSPDAGVCCGDDCQFRPQGSQVCEPGTECTSQSVCTGTDFLCPKPQPKVNGTLCNSFSQVCVQGECIGSVCQHLQDSGKVWDTCFITSKTGNSSEMCHLACKNPATGECVSSLNNMALSKAQNSAFRALLLKIAQLKAEAPKHTDLPLKVTLPPGSVCDNYRGYCDTFSVCQHIDSKGPFLQLAHMIFNPVSLRKVREWITENWWAMFLISLAWVLLMGVMVKLCEYHTPSQNPRLVPTQPAPQPPRQHAYFCIPPSPVQRPPRQRPQMPTQPMQRSPILGLPMQRPRMPSPRTQIIAPMQRPQLQRLPVQRPPMQIPPAQRPTKQGSERSGEMPRPAENSGDTSRSSERSGDRSTSLERFEEKSQSSERSGDRSTSLERSGHRSRSMERTGDRSRSFERSGDRSTSLERFGDRSTSLERFGDRSRSFDRSGDTSRSLERSGDMTGPSEGWQPEMDFQVDDAGNSV